MPEPSTEETHTVDDFAEFLETLKKEGFEHVVIGGCAVGAYAHLRGETVLTADLDILSPPQVLNEILEWAPQNGVKLLKWPQPRTIPTAFLVWKDKEINILSSSHGFPPAGDAIQAARVFVLRSRGNTEVLIADCYHLLQNKLTVNRTKDQPHIDVLRRFIEEEIVRAFEVETDQRNRLGPARRLLEITKSRTLPEALGSRLIPLAHTGPDLRFLANTVLTPDQARSVLEKARAQPEVVEQIEKILKVRGFAPPD